jgi:cytochrome d ubiquinol oxidase subunit II
VDSARWRTAWDLAFGLGSLLPAILFGVAFGNILRGIPVDGGGTFTGTFPGLLNPFALLIGLLGLTLFTMHGAAYLTLKTDGDLRGRLTRWASGGWMGTVVLYIAATLAATAVSPFLFDGILTSALFWILFPVVLAAIILFPVFLAAARYGRAFLASSVMIAGMIGLSATSLFPRLVPSITDPAYSLTVYNASSSQTTLTVMLVIALIGMPLVIGYTIFIYRVFKGKTVISSDSY